MVYVIMQKCGEAKKVKIVFSSRERALEWIADNQCVFTEYIIEEAPAFLELCIHRNVEYNGIPKKGE